MNGLPETYFNDYEAFSENEIVEVTKDGIILQNGIIISFLRCAENFKKAYPKSSEKCIGEREITDWSFTFFSDPKPIMIKFLPRNKITEFLSKNNMVKRFHSLQQKINDFGFSTYDIT